MTQGDWIKKARTDAGYTLEEVAAAVGTTKQTIYKYESNIVTNIPMDRTKAMADFLGVTPSQLLGWDGSSDIEGPGYEKDETLLLAEELRRSPGMRMMFDAAKGCTEEDMRRVAAMIKAYKGDDE